MPISAKTIRKQLSILKPFLKGSSLKTIRKRQNKLGELMESKYRKVVLIKKHAFEQFNGAWVIPKDERRQGVILYLHGGGYACGDLEYALGAGSLFAVQTGARVFCAAYRLAPENPYPAALEDALEAYRYLLDKGYAASRITLCGDSAGCGLCYALCLRLRQQGLPMPCSIISLSPWVDLTLSGESYAFNRDRDPNMSKELLAHYADLYTDDKTNIYASPIYADLTGMPPSLIFVGGDEIMLDDARRLHERLGVYGCKSRLYITPDRWHDYLLYGLDEDQKDFATINRFLNVVMSQENKLRWLPLDNAAKLYPAARRQNWSNVFRMSATLREEVDVKVLQTALDVTLRRFPSIAVRLRRGVFWYYLQQLSETPKVREENSYPLTRMSRSETRKCAFRVIVYKRRIAIEIFHSLTDGTGAMIFLKSLVAEYLQQKHGLSVPAEHGVVGRLEEPSEPEMEDSFQKYAGNVAAKRQGSTAWRMSGTPEHGGFLNVTCFTLPVKDVLNEAHAYGMSLTGFLCAVMMQALQNLQKEKVPNLAKRKPIKVMLPVNLRSLFESQTLRNFVMDTTPEILPVLGEYSFEEICQAVRARMSMDINPKFMSTKIAANVKSERPFLIRIIPLFIKNIVMKAVFTAVGERRSCVSLSNLGAVRLPEAMMPYVERMDFILGIQATAPYNCGMLSFGDTLYINFIRNIREPDLEMHFYRVLQEMGLPVTVESNRNA